MKRQKFSQEINISKEDIKNLSTCKSLANLWTEQPTGALVGAGYCGQVSGKGGD